jgi:hypothetical protein
MDTDRLTHHLVPNAWPHSTTNLPTSYEHGVMEGCCLDTLTLSTDVLPISTGKIRNDIYRGGMNGAGL